MDNKQELNKKLDKWAGFELKPTERSFNTIDWPYYSWYTPQGEILWSEDMLPNFTNSLDAYYEWLEPKVKNLKGLGHPFIIKLVSGCGECGEYSAEITNPTLWKESHHTSRYALEFSHNPALALCLAIEKLIDGESK